MVIVQQTQKRKLLQALFVLFAVTAMSAKHAMALVGKVEWVIFMTTMEQVSTRFLVEIAAMGVLKEMAFAISANKVTTKGYF